MYKKHILKKENEIHFGPEVLNKNAAQSFKCHEKIYVAKREI